MNEEDIKKRLEIAGRQGTLNPYDFRDDRIQFDDLSLDDFYIAMQSSYMASQQKTNQFKETFKGIVLGSKNVSKFSKLQNRSSIPGWPDSEDNSKELIIRNVESSDASIPNPLEQEVHGVEEGFKRKLCKNLHTKVDVPTSGVNMSTPPPKNSIINYKYSNYNQKGAEFIEQYGPTDLEDRNIVLGKNNGSTMRTFESSKKTPAVIEPVRTLVGPPLRPPVGDEKTRVKIAMDILIDQGASIHGAAAIVGNMLAESQLLVDRLEIKWSRKKQSYWGGVSLVQWTNWRRENFEKHFGIANSIKQRKELIGIHNETVEEYQEIVRAKVSFEAAVLYYWNELKPPVRIQLKSATDAGQASEAILADLRPGAYLCWDRWTGSPNKYCQKGQETLEQALDKKNETRDRRAKQGVRALKIYNS